MDFVSPLSHFSEKRIYRALDHRFVYMFFNTKWFHKIGMGIHHDVTLVTFDRNIPIHAAIGFKDRHLKVL